MRSGKDDRILPNWGPLHAFPKPREGVSFYHKGGGLNERNTSRIPFYRLESRPEDQTCRDAAQVQRPPCSEAVGLSEFEMIVRAANDLDDDGC